MIEPTAPHQYTLIFLHGWAEKGGLYMDRMDVVAKAIPGLKIILPTSSRLVDMTGKLRRSWFPFIGDENARRPDAEGLLAGKVRVWELIEDEVRGAGIPFERIFVGGFSQGAAMALFASLSYYRRLGGVISLFPSLPKTQRVLRLLCGNFNRIPVFFGYRPADEIVGERWGAGLLQLLREDWMEVTAREYAGTKHTINPEEYQDVIRFIKEQGEHRINSKL